MSGLTGVLFGPKTSGRTPEDVEREYGWSLPETPAAPALVPTGGES